MKTPNRKDDIHEKFQRENVDSVTHPLYCGLMVAWFTRTACVMFLLSNLKLRIYDNKSTGETLLVFISPICCGFSSTFYRQQHCPNKNLGYGNCVIVDQFKNH